MNTLKHLLVSTLVLITASFSFAQGDPLGIVNENKMIKDGLVLRNVQTMAMDDWDKALEYLDKDKLKFFYLDDRVRFIDYVYGFYDDFDEDPYLRYYAEDKAIFYLDYLAFILNNKELYNASDVRSIIKQIKDFEVVFFVRYDIKLKLYNTVNMLNKVLK